MSTDVHHGFSAVDDHRFLICAFTRWAVLDAYVVDLVGGKVERACIPSAPGVDRELPAAPIDHNRPERIGADVLDSQQDLCTATDDHRSKIKIGGIGGEVFLERSRKLIVPHPDSDSDATRRDILGTVEREVGHAYVLEDRAGDRVVPIAPGLRGCARPDANSTPLARGYEVWAKVAVEIKELEIVENAIGSWRIPGGPAGAPIVEVDSNAERAFVRSECQVR